MQRESCSSLTDDQEVAPRIGDTAGRRPSLSRCLSLAASAAAPGRSRLLLQGQPQKHSPSFILLFLFLLLLLLCLLGPYLRHLQGVLWGGSLPVRQGTREGRDCQAVRGLLRGVEDRGQRSLLGHRPTLQGQLSEPLSTRLTVLYVRMYVCMYVSRARGRLIAI